MVRINLLPHRELKRKRQRDAFAALSVMTLLVGGAIVFAVYAVIGSHIEQQQGRNSYLDGEIAKLDKEIEEIRKLREQTQAMLARKKVVETLQANRSEAVHLLDQLVRQLPEGVYLKSVKQGGSIVNVSGFAQSNARVSSLLRNLEASPWLEQPSLVEIKAASAGNTRLSEFSINVRLTRTVSDALDTGKRLATPPKEKQS